MRRSKHSLSHYNLLTMDMGQLVPLTWFEANPGDTIQQATSCLLRVSPLLSPVYHPVRVRLHHWFVPYRLIWDNWESFITGGENGKDNSIHPHLAGPVVASGDLLDYLGIPPGDYSTTGVKFNALPLRAYNLIFDEHYRDQQIINERVISRDDGDDTTTEKQILNVAWEKDYYTTTRPEESLGDPVLLNLGDKAPISGFGKENASWADSPPGAVLEAGGTSRTYASAERADTGGGANQRLWMEEDPDHPGYPAFYADLSQATGITVNQLREALAIQRYQEARNTYGARYIEYLRYLGVRSSDARLQNPEYIGGGSRVISFSEIIQTSEGTKPVGHLVGHGIAAMRSRRHRRFFEEHGLCMTLMSVIPKAMYMQAGHKKWFRTTKEDYFQRELQYLGDQIVENQEAFTLHSNPTGPFGFQNRYDDYRHHPSLVAGEFNDVLNYWHYARDFQSDVALNESFITAVPTKRPNADQVSHVLWVMTNHSIQARRLLIRDAKPRTF